MARYTIDDVKHIIPEPLTGRQVEGVEAYLNDGIVPPLDPCLECEPNQIRKLIARIQKAEREGTLKRQEEPEVTTYSVDPEPQLIGFEEEFVPAQRDETDN